MSIMGKINRQRVTQGHSSSISLLLDLALYLSVMFLIREIYFSQFHFIANGLFWSFTTLALACILMKIRKVSWFELGLCQPKNGKHTLWVTLFILCFSIVSIGVFHLIKDKLGLALIPDTSNDAAAVKFGALAGHWMLFFSIIPFIWLQSMLEELLDRGFLINWIEKLFSSALWSTFLALVIQAALFGFRHANELSERSVTVGLIGLSMGLGYICFGRNLWPLIIAHCLLNTLSMLDRVLSP